LRTPGTHHRKAGIRLVQCSRLVGPYALEQFAILLSVGGEATPSSNPKPKASSMVNELGPIAPHLANPPVEKVREKLHRSLRSAFKPSLGTLVAEQCEQLRALRDTKGNLSEPLWYANLGVLAFCVDGEPLGQEWSSGYGGYTPEETQERLDRARQFGPTTCKKFHELNPTICESCPWFQKITSPIVLGREYCGSGNRDQQSLGGVDANSTEQESNRSRTGPRQDSHGSENEETIRAEQQTNYSHEGSNQTAFPLRWHGEDDANIKREWLVKQMLPKTGVGLISGQWGTAKTFIALDLAASVMMGTKFAGRPVKRRGGVLFLAAEGSSEIPIRLCGLVEAKFPGQKDRLPFAWGEGCPTLMQAGAIEQLVQIAKQAADHMQSEFGVELVLIIIDTMSAAAGFKDENSSPEGQLAMNVLNELSKRTGAFAIACDHFGKMVETGTRGTSAKEASADVVIACLGDRTQAGSLANLRIAVRKLRGGATGGETALRLRTVDLGVDEDREPITTCVVEWSTVTVAAPPDAANGKGWPKSAIPFRGALVTTLKLHGTEQRRHPDGPTVFAVELDKVREEFDKCYPLDGSDRKKELNKRRQAFKRSTATVQSRGLIEGREIEESFWFGLPTRNKKGLPTPALLASKQRDSSVTNVTPP
jgi:AAA domain